VIDCPQTPPDEVLLETLMLGLRLAEGVSLSALAQQFGEEILEKLRECLQPYQQKDWVEFVSNGEHTEQLRLTDPEGFLFSNVILADLFSQLG
jgi:oxygen-independent coproporphyrinogen-3 oxidase